MYRYEIYLSDGRTVVVKSVKRHERGEVFVLYGSDDQVIAEFAVSDMVGYARIKAAEAIV